MEYDSKDDTYRHINRVQALIDIAIENLIDRAGKHDQSKLSEPEKTIFDKYTPLLRETTYGSNEYKKFMDEMQIGLKHHYATNSHHPEHFDNGINGMSLFDLIEMLCDWKAATERHADGNLARSVDINEKRFGINPQLISILRNTIKEMGW